MMNKITSVFFILGVPICFPQSTEKFYVILKPAQKKRGKSLSSHLHPSSLLFPPLVALKKGEWGLDAQQLAQPELVQQCQCHQWMKRPFSSSPVAVLLCPCCDSPHLLKRTALPVLNDHLPGLVIITQATCLLTDCPPLARCPLKGKA